MNKTHIYRTHVESVKGSEPINSNGKQMALFILN